MWPAQLVLYPLLVNSDFVNILGSGKGRDNFAVCDQANCVTVISSLAVIPKFADIMPAVETKPKAATLSRIGLMRRLNHLIRSNFPPRRGVGVGALTFFNWKW